MFPLCAVQCGSHWPHVAFFFFLKIHTLIRIAEKIFRIFAFVVDVFNRLYVPAESWFCIAIKCSFFFFRQKLPLVIIPQLFSFFFCFLFFLSMTFFYSLVLNLLQNFSTIAFTDIQLMEVFTVVTFCGEGFGNIYQTVMLRLSAVVIPVLWEAMVEGFLGAGS